MITPLVSMRESTTLRRSSALSGLMTGLYIVGEFGMPMSVAA